MKFTIKFRGNDGGSAIAMGSKKLGLAWVDQARKEAELPDLELGRIQQELWTDSSNSTIFISEELARQSGLFQDFGEVIVTVPRKSLNRFLRIEADVDKDPETGEIKLVKPRHQLDTQAVAEAWITAGYPTNWRL